MVKVCPYCKKEKEFYSTFKCSYCIDCWRAYHKRWKDNNRSRHLEISKECWDKNKDKYNLERKLGGPSVYSELFTRQQGVCAICELPESSTRYKTLSVDHNHVTGKIRGLLCSSCNRGLGLLKDSPDILLKAINYLHEKN